MICPIHSALKVFLHHCGQGELFPLTGKNPKLLVAFSGGLDSTVLLHALVAANRTQSYPLHAVHIDHGLHADSDHWRQHCKVFANHLGVKISSVKVEVTETNHYGPEGAARRARYAALESLMHQGDLLLTAHHADDQAETFLLRALRASSLEGLASMRPIRTFGPGYLCRPFLDLPRSEIVKYAKQHQLNWIEDPSNASSIFDRNFIRHQVLPLIAQRWPQAQRALADTAHHLRTAHAAARTELDRQLDIACGDTRDQIRLDSLRSLKPDNASLLLKTWIFDLGFPPPPAKVLKDLLQKITYAADDRNWIVRWSNTEIRRFRNQLFALPCLPEAAHFALSWNTAKPLHLDDGRTLSILGTAPPRQFTVKSRVEGEKIRIANDRPERKVRLLFQEHSILPWQRERAPYIYDGPQLIAVGTWFLDTVFAQWLASHQASLHLDDADDRFRSSTS